MKFSQLPGIEDVVDKYRIRQELGSGGTGVVFLAEDESLGREVAIKMVRPALALDSKNLERFRREARAVAALSHPNIVHINALIETDDCVIIEMPFLPGGSFRDRMNQGASLGSVVRMLHGTLLALDCCHGAGTVHRDIKPSNILFDRDDTPKLSDFGVAALAHEQWSATVTQDTTTTVFVGTPQYACPEAWNGGEPSPGWDLYALGMTVREAVLGELPYSNATPLALIRDILEKQLPPACEANPELSGELGGLIDAMSATDPAKRLDSAGDALEVLNSTSEFARLGSKDASTVTITVPRVLNAKRADHSNQDSWSVRIGKSRMPTWWAAASLVVMAALWALSWQYFQPDPVELTGAVAIEDTSNPTSQATAFRASLPDPDEITGLVREPTRGLIGLYEARAGLTPQRSNYLLFRRAHAEEPATLVGTLSEIFTWMTLSESAAGHYDVSGVWGSYADNDGRALMVGRISGTAEWGGSLDAPCWISLDYISDVDMDAWTDTVFAVPSSSALTDTAVQLQWERHPTAMPALFRDLLPRYTEAARWARQSLPALVNARIDVARINDDLNVVVDGNLDEDAWRYLQEKALSARPLNSGITLMAVASTDALYFAIDASVQDEETPNVRFALLPGYWIPVEASPQLQLHVGEDIVEALWIHESLETPLASEIRSASTVEADRWNFEIEIPFNAMQRESLPASGEVFRMNVQISDSQGDVLAAWGWPELDRVEHGAVVAFE